MLINNNLNLMYLVKMLKDKNLYSNHKLIKMQNPPSQQHLHHPKINPHSLYASSTNHKLIK